VKPKGTACLSLPIYEAQGPVQATDPHVRKEFCGIFNLLLYGAPFRSGWEISVRSRLIIGKVNVEILGNLDRYIPVNPYT